MTFRTKLERNNSARYEIYPAQALLTLPNGEFLIQIRHTARSWGVDIESLLTGHLATLRLKDSGLRKFLNSYSGYIGWLGTVSLMTATAVGIYITMLKFSEAQIAEFKSLLHQTTSGSNLSALESLGSIILSGAYPRFTVAVIFFVLAMLIASIAFGIILDTKASSRRSSFLTLTKEAERARLRARDGEGAYSKYFFGTFVGGIISGVVGNAIFLYIFGR